VAAVHRELEQGGRRIADLERSLEDARAQLATAEVQRRLAEDRIAIVERSRSWRLTAPLRDSRGMASRAMLRGRVALADGARAIYRLRSLTSETKVRLKDVVFASVPSLVRATGASKRWQQEQKRTRAARGTPFEQPAPVSRRPRIVVVSHDALLYGAQLIAVTLARTLVEQLGYEVEILLCGDGPLKAEMERVGRVHEFFTSTATVEVRERIVGDLYVRGARVAFCNTSCVGDTVELLKSAGFTVVSLVHELPGLIREYGLEASCAKIARSADRVVFPADVVRRCFIGMTAMRPEKAVVRAQGLLAPNSFAGRRSEARSQLRARLRLHDGVAIVIGVGSADRRKGIDLFTDVGLKLSGRLKDVVFVWVGQPETGAFTSVQARIAEAGAESRFVFPGVVEKPDVFFAGADVYLMTSREDPFPLVVLHALDAEVPVIGFEGGGGFVELLQRDCGILVEYLDTAAMAEALLRLLNDPGERQRLGARGREIVTREFSFVDYARDLVRLVDSQRPSVSVIVPNYNYAHYLPARLRSILAQSYAPHEIIFLDDCSSDGSAEVAEALLSEADIPYRIIRNETNQGCYRQWLRGIRESTGDLVWIAEADDDCAPTLLESLVRAFARESVVLAYSQSKQIDDEGAELAPDYLGWTADISPTKWRHAYVRDGKDEIRDSLAVKNTIPNVSAVLMRKPDLSEIEPLLVTLRNVGDWLVYVYLLERGDIAFSPVAVNYHRRHRRSITIGYGGSEQGRLNVMRETMLMQRYVLERYIVAPDVGRKRAAYLQATYEYLGLHADGPPSYKDHEALRDVSWAVVG
jgi:glycosyltransferase involved in cell wall biosynthesis